MTEPAVNLEDVAARLGVCTSIRKPEQAVEQPEMPVGMRLTSRNVSTDTEVASLHRLTLALTPGDVLTYEAIIAAIGIDRDNHRWRSVMGRLMRRESKEYNREYRSIPNVGYRLLAPEGRIDKAQSCRNAGDRKLLKARTIANTTAVDGLSSESAMIREHLLRTAGAQLAIAEAAKTAARQEMRIIKKSKKEKETTNE